MNGPARGPSAPVDFWRLVDAGEPFRLLFPWGVALGLAGVAAWPLYAWGFTHAYPGQIHARIMVEGFLTAFIMGFLGTALPRLLEVPPFRLSHSVLLSGALGMTVVLHYGGHGLFGDVVFFMTLGIFISLLLLRARQRRGVPPPSFVLVTLGLLSGWAGSGLQILDQAYPTSLTPWVASLGRGLLHQAYPLLPVMGIGVFLLPRFFGLRGREDVAHLLLLKKGWWLQAFLSTTAGILVLISLVLEAKGHVRTGYGLRLLTVAGFFAVGLPGGKFLRGQGTLLLGVKIALVSIVAGYALLAFLPSFLLTWLHLVFVTGFSLLVFMVASRVVLGHSGQGAVFDSRLWSMIAVIALVLIAAITRITADWMGERRFGHYAYAALVWTSGALIWLGALRSSFTRADVE